MFDHCSNCILVYTTQVNSTFHARWLASSEVIGQVLFTSEQPKENRMAFVGTFSQIKLLFGPLDIQLVWCILKQLFTSVSVKVMDICNHFGEWLSTALSYFILFYIIAKLMYALWLVNQLWFIVPVNSWKNRAASELLYKSNRPQVSMVYRLINHLGCW